MNEIVLYWLKYYGIKITNNNKTILNNLTLIVSILFYTDTYDINSSTKDC